MNNKQFDSNYEIMGVLGEGSFGKVYLIQDKHTEILYALKSIDNKLTSGYRINNEIEHLQRVGFTPFATELFFSFNTPTKMFLVMEYIEGNTLKDIMKKYHLEQEDILFFFIQMVICVGAIHEMGVQHRDLKTANIMIDNNGKITLIDFGLSSSGMVKGTNQINPAYDKIINEKVLRSSQVGSPLYGAPEVRLLYMQGYEPCQADVWSLGVILFEMLTGSAPFITKNLEEFDILMNKYSSISDNSQFDWNWPSNINTLVKDLILQMLQPNPNKRITINQIQQHPAIPEENWSRIEKNLEKYEKVFYKNNGLQPMNHNLF